jgi:hypothetical protein
MEDPGINAENDLEFVLVLSFRIFWCRYIQDKRVGCSMGIAYSFWEISTTDGHPARWYNSRKTTNNRRMVPICLFELFKMLANLLSDIIFNCFCFF